LVSLFSLLFSSLVFCVREATRDLFILGVYYEVKETSPWVEFAVQFKLHTL